MSVEEGLTDAADLEGGEDDCSFENIYDPANGTPLNSGQVSSGCKVSQLMSGLPNGAQLPSTISLVAALKSGLCVEWCRLVDLLGLPLALVWWWCFAAPPLGLARLGPLCGAPACLGLHLGQMISP